MHWMAQDARKVCRHGKMITALSGGISSSHSSGIHNALDPDQVPFGRQIRTAGEK